ncbi:nucleotide exchange factor GrpE [Nodosilinea sp. P-1105]|uniref:nucleotide exchange factor GrpE n=1 Tax=Nodosilinea sp. P-1105 TaxID=2546229 RepID=UPI00146D489D|nr:nucleotide exchange factor GrpE [Nodosilinea sp. P-1105]NMF83441.1 nucleotide exchange factor GrpE [Nodosilinea sp. P-1105]
MTRSPRELATQKIQLRKQQEALLKDLLPILDALDRAADHWQQAQATQTTSTPAQPQAWWQRWLQRLGLGNLQKSGPEAASLETVVTSAHDGIAMIRESMLTVLDQHQVVPLPAVGQPFDPSHMHALGQQPDPSVPPNTVVQEVVRGYRWQDRMLREAQVIVAVAPTEPS